MAKEPPSSRDRDDEPKSKAVAKRDAPEAVEAEATEGTGELPSQLVPYPTGNPPPAKDHLGRSVDEDGNLIEETP